MSSSQSDASRQRTRFMAVVVAAVLIIIGAFGYIAWNRIHPATPPDYQSAGNGVAELVEIPAGSSISQLGPELVKRGIVKSNGAFQAAAVANPAASNVTPGFYKLQGQMSAAAAVNALLDPASKVETLKVTPGATLFDVHVVGGKTRPGIYSQIAALSCGSASNANCVTQAKLQQAATSGDLAALGVPEWARRAVAARGADPRRLEGLIAPGDYVVNPTHSAAEILKDLLTRSAQTWDKAGITASGGPAKFSPYAKLIAASLVERESPAGEFPKVARVIDNRLARPMRLEFDSTVNYDLPDQEVATTDADRARVTPWNTYAKDGLPDTPIASPSVEALTAVEHPAEGNWLFFVTVDKSGKTVFTDNFDDHQKAAAAAGANGVLDSHRSEKAPAPAPAPAPNAPAGQ